MSERRMTDETTCPHCGHEWSQHQRECFICGWWANPTETPTAPLPPTPRQLAIGRVRDAIFAELSRQHENDDMNGPGYWDNQYGVLDGEPDWSLVAEAALKASEEPS